MDAVECLERMKQICQSHSVCSECPLNFADSSSFCIPNNGLMYCDDIEKQVKIIEGLVSK